MENPKTPKNPSTGLMFGVITMTTREIAEVTGKQHKHVLRDTREMLVQLWDGYDPFEGGPDLDHQSYQGVSWSYDGRGYLVEIRLPKREVVILVSGYDVHMRAKTVDRLEELETAAKAGTLGGLAIEQIVDSVAARLDRMIDDRLARDPRAAAITALSTRELLDEAKVPSKGRRPLIRKATHRLSAFCLSRGVTAYRCPRTKTWLWPKAAAEEWMDAAGRSLIAEHAAKQAGQSVLPFRKPREA